MDDALAVKHAAIPSFFLYGEPPRAVGDRFLHLEALDDRSRPNDWNIRPHAHANLNHVFHIVAGSGEMLADGRAFRFAAPCLLIVPAGAVHGFAYEVGAAGSVLTISEAYLQEILRREVELRGIFTAPAAVPIAKAAVFDDGFDRLARELSWTAPGHAAAVDALLVTLFVEMLRLRRFADPEAHAHGGHAALVARYRELVEQRYRIDTSVETYAEALAVSPKRLRAACQRVANQTPLAILHERLALEAKRLLLYSNMTVAEAGYHLGFSDPAYFSRFFVRSAGASPRSFRAGAQTAEAA
jgi:AraC family transcriptional activator of pobA